jgi:hypothetical protein
MQVKGGFFFISFIISMFNFNFRSIIFELMKSKGWLVAFLGFFIGGKAIAQQPFQLWTTYNHQARLSNKWGYTFDLNYRTRGVLPFTSSLAAVRMGVVYQVNPKIRITAGYAWFGTWVKDRYQIWLHENRLYQQIQYNTRKANLQFSQRIRLEQRFRQSFLSTSSDEVNVFFTFRARYLFQMQGPLLRKSGTDEVILSWQAANEIFFHWGDNIGSTNFEQNRTLAGIVISVNKKIDFAALYQLILQHQPLLLKTQPINSVRLTIFHNLDFRKK